MEAATIGVFGEDEDEIDDDDVVDVEERVDDEVDDVVASTAALAIVTEF